MQNALSDLDQLHREGGEEPNNGNGAPLNLDQLHREGGEELNNGNGEGANNGQGAAEHGVNGGGGGANGDRNQDGKVLAHFLAITLTLSNFFSSYVNNLKVWRLVMLRHNNLKEMLQILHNLMDLGRLLLEGRTSKKNEMPVSSNSGEILGTVDQCISGNGLIKY